jgi:hypothetical protein
MDLNKFFNQFTNDPSSSTQDEVIASYTDFYNNPIFKLGMFKKLVFNHVNFNKKLLFSLLDAASSDGDKESKKIKEFSELMIYNRAYNQLEDINFENDKNYIKQASDEELLTACKLAIKFFEEREEYEKCAKIKVLEDLVSFFIK